MVELICCEGIILYTNGIPEAFNIEKKKYAIARLCKVISRNWHVSAEEIKQTVIDDEGIKC